MTEGACLLDGLADAEGYIPNAEIVTSAMSAAAILVLSVCIPAQGQDAKSRGNES
jgi:hypothetical protein